MTTRIVAPTERTLARSADLLRAGELVAFPTETVYGLGADADNPEAVQRIFAAKGRPPEHPVIVHIPAATHATRWARSFPEEARRLAAAFWPGPLTLILPRAARVPDVVTGRQDNVGLRVPSHPVARQLLAAFVEAGGSGIAAPSANRYGGISPTRAQHVAADLGESVALIIDGGACDVGIESTIVAFTTGEPVLLRPGGVPATAIERILGRALHAGTVSSPRAPGTTAAHYAPRTAASLVAANALLAEIAQRTDRDEEVAVLARTVSRPEDFADTWIQGPASATDYARALYANLRALDAAEADHILIEAVPVDESWVAVRDRLTRATRGEVDDRD